MFPMATLQGGGCLGQPDTCLTPAPPAAPAPMAYPNSANLTQANPSTCSKKVKICNKAVVTTQSQISLSSGDEAGSAGGVVSGMIKGPISFKQGSTKVKVEGQPPVMQLKTAAHNGTNANAPPGSLTSCSQSKVSLGS